MQVEIKTIETINNNHVIKIISDNSRNVHTALMELRPEFERLIKQKVKQLEY